MLNGRWPHSWCEIGTLVGAFNQEKVLVGPSPWLWNIHEPSDNLRLKFEALYKLSPSLLSPPLVWPGGENMMKPWVWIWRVKVSSNIAYRSGPGSATSTLAPPIQHRFFSPLFISYCSYVLSRPSPPSAAVSRDSMLNKKSDQRVDSVLVPGTASPWTSAVNLLFVLSEAGWMASLELRITIAAQYSETFINFLKPIDCSWYCSLVR